MEQVRREESFPIFFFVKMLIFSYIITGILLALLAFVLYKAGMGEAVVSVAIIAIYVVATVFGGYVTGKKMGKRRFVWGFLMGSAYFLLLTIVSLLVGEEGFCEANSFWTTLIICAGGGMLGGMLS